MIVRSPDRSFVTYTWYAPAGRGGGAFGSSFFGVSGCVQEARSISDAPARENNVRLVIMLEPFSVENCRNLIIGNHSLTVFGAYVMNMPVSTPIDHMPLIQKGFWMRIQRASLLGAAFLLLLLAL